jgi:hypothetical protein
MSTTPPQSDMGFAELLQEVVGYLNFSSGLSDDKFLANINQLFCRIEGDANRGENCVASQLCQSISKRIDELASSECAFTDVTQARAVNKLLIEHLLPAYQQFHRDLLGHQKDSQLWRPFFLGRAFEAVLVQGGPWNETNRIVDGAIQKLNDHIGYRPVAVLESESAMEPYKHEWVRPIPLYIERVGFAHGPYEELISTTFEILRKTDTELLREAWFDPDLLSEVALDPRAYDFDHPVGKRPNYQFGHWDPHTIDNRGNYRRFILQQGALDSLLTRIEQLGISSEERTVKAEGSSDVSRADDTTSQSPTRYGRQELMVEAATVLAGTILMASGTSGNGPSCHGSDISLATLLPHIAGYRDRFYKQLLEQMDSVHAERLRAEAELTHQPFGRARQHLNQELARRRAKQLQHVHLAQIFARMGYPEAALRQACTVQVTSARLVSQIYCRLTAGHHAIEAGEMAHVAECLVEIEDLIERGIHCGALVDPWNIIGFGGNFSLFPALENSIRDFRVDDLIDLVEQTLDLYSRAWTEAAACDDTRQEELFADTMDCLAGWWDQFATTSVSGVKHLVGKEVRISTDLVAGALSAWHKAGAAAGDIAFWRQFIDVFDSPKAFQLVVEALLDQGDLIASMALMMQWVSQIEQTPLEDGDASFHPLALRWLRMVEARQHESGENQWSLVEKFFIHLEASSETYWHVPDFAMGTPQSELNLDDPAEPDSCDEQDRNGAEDYDADFESEAIDEEDELDNLFSAAYMDVVYRDSTDDGFEGQMLEDGHGQSDLEQEEEARRLEQRLAFLTTVARLWKHTAIVWDADDESSTNRRDSLEQWHQDATTRYSQLVQLLEVVHGYHISLPSGSHESMVEFDHRRMIQDSNLEHIITTCVEMSDAGRLLRAAIGGAAIADASRSPAPIRRTVELLRAALAGDTEAIRRHWGPFKHSLLEQELLYMPLSKGGSPHRIVKARALGQLIYDLLGWLPRLGLIRETCELLAVTQAMETQHQVGHGAVTDYDRLFTRGYQAIVQCLVASADHWDETDSDAQMFTIGDHAGEPKVESENVRSSDSMLVEALQDFTESQLQCWLEHSRTLRLNVVEKLTEPSDWESFVDFVQRYGADLFTQKFLNLGNLRAILHQRTAVWLSNLDRDYEGEQLFLLEELGTNISRAEAGKWLALAVESVVENFREYRDYNITTTQSDHGELIYTFIDFMRLKAGYNRVAWNLKPVVMAHEILVRKNRLAAAELWQRAFADRTADVADVHLKKLGQLSANYGMRLPTVAERLAERFTRPLAIDRIRALVAPAMAPADERGEIFAALEWEIEILAEKPAGAGLDVPDWVTALEDEVTSTRVTKRHRESTGDLLRRVGQTPLPWKDLQDQLRQDSEPHAD